MLTSLVKSFFFFFLSPSTKNQGFTTASWYFVYACCHLISNDHKGHINLKHTSIKSEVKVGFTIHDACHYVQLFSCMYKKQQHANASSPTMQASTWQLQELKQIFFKNLYSTVHTTLSKLFVVVVNTQLLFHTKISVSLPSTGQR